MNRRPLHVAVAGIATTLMLAGCTDPYATAPERRRQPPPGELAAPSVRATPHRIKSRQVADSPHAAARRAAELVGNWTGETVAARYAQLAAFSIGQARAAAQSAAAQLPTDAQLTAPGARGSTTVEAVIARGSGPTRTLLVVTRDRVEADGHHQTRWRITIAETRSLSGGWALSRWEPQP